jgi:drug/metabolite transporter (DMT)-like permease
VLVWPQLTLDSADSRHFLIGVIALQVASLGWSLGSAYSRRHGRDDHVLGTTALQMLAGGLMLLAAGTIRGEWSQLGFNLRTTTALLYLATLGAIGGFVAYTYALRHLPVSFVSLYAYINPVIAVALGVVLLGEPFDWRIAAAAVLVLGGVGMVRSKTTGAATTGAVDPGHHETIQGST